LIKIHEPRLYNSVIELIETMLIKKGMNHSQCCKKPVIYMFQYLEKYNVLPHENVKFKPKYQLWHKI